MIIEAEPGESSNYFCQRLIELAKEYNRPVSGIFNECKTTAYPDSTVREVGYLLDYNRLFNRMERESLRRVSW